MKYNRQRIEEDAVDSKSRGAGGVYLNLNDGERVEGRVLPVEDLGDDAELELYVRFGQHYIKSQEAYYTCLNELDVSRWTPEAWGKKPCEFCKRWAELRGSRDEDDQEEAQKFKVSIRFMMHFYVGGAVKIFRMNSKTQPLLAELAYGTDFTDVLELKDGRNVVFKRTGEKLETNYTVTPSKETSTVPRSVLKELHDLYAELKVLEPKKQREVLKGGEPDESEYITVRELINLAGGKPVTRRVAVADDDDEPRPAASKKSKGDDEGEPELAKPVVARKKKAEPEPEDDGAARRPTKAEAKELTAYGDELGLEIDMDNTVKAIVDAIVDSACDGETKTKGLSDEFKEWLEARGCDASGKLVEKAKPAKASAAKSADDDASDLDRQLAKVRAASKGKGK